MNRGQRMVFRTDRATFEKMEEMLKPLALFTDTAYPEPNLLIPVSNASFRSGKMTGMTMWPVLIVEDK